MSGTSQVTGKDYKSGQEGKKPTKADPLSPVRGGKVTSTAAGYVVERFRWWHIDEVMPIEEDLFGPEKWSSAMFWNELATHQFYLVALGHPREAGVAEAAAGEVAVGEAGVGRSVLGYAGLSVVDEHESWVQNIAVRREAQRLGIGRGLLEALLAEAARRGSRKTLLEVAVDNAPAQKLYATYGFEPVGIRRGYYQPSNTDALVMMRDA